VEQIEAKVLPSIRRAHVFQRPVHPRSTLLRKLAENHHDYVVLNVILHQRLGLVGVLHVLGAFHASTFKLVRVPCVKHDKLLDFISELPVDHLMQSVARDAVFASVYGHQWDGVAINHQRLFLVFCRIRRYIGSVKGFALEVACHWCHVVSKHDICFRGVSRWGLPLHTFVP
jgi:hypothetical protein